jgi:hypothetical protein
VANDNCCYCFGTAVSKSEILIVSNVFHTTLTNCTTIPSFCPFSRPHHLPFIIQHTLQPHRNFQLHLHPNQPLHARATHLIGRIDMTMRASFTNNVMSLVAPIMGWIMLERWPPKRIIVAIA